MLHCSKLCKPSKISYTAVVSQPKRLIVIVLPDIRSLHNVGSFFRTGDAVGASKIVLCGTTGTPENPKLKKVSLGAELTVPWEYVADTTQALQQLSADGYQIVIVEKTNRSVDYQSIKYGDKVALVFGAETSGVPQLIQDQGHVTVHLPMTGTKRSLNVSVAGGVMLYHLYTQH
jgi:tRNA G18 (ribose-2'-O)-methylase SpoU